MLKHIVLSSASLLAFTAFAAAADLPSRMAPPVYAPAPLPIFTWTGAYFGINAGYAFDHQGSFRTTPAIAGFGNRTGTVSSDGFTGGGQIGYNYQFGPGNGVVIGLEADAAYTDLDRTRAVPYGVDGSALGGRIATYRSGLDYLGTVRGRLGYAFNQFLVYGTGGLAYGGVDNRVAVQFAPGGALIAGGRVNDTETGYVYGGGVEYALPTNSVLNFMRSSAVTVKAEYLHYDLGHTNIALNSVAAGAGTTRVSNDGDLVRAGLNFKFGAY